MSRTKFQDFGCRSELHENRVAISADKVITYGLKSLKIPVYGFSSFFLKISLKMN